MTGSIPVSALFEPEPIQWGLRGDPHLWGEMRERFADVPCPASADELGALVAAAFEQLTGAAIHHASSIRVERYPQRGMSGGAVSPEFWRDRAIPLLRRRHADLRQMLRPPSTAQADMRPLRYSINVTLDGCCDHRAGIASEELHHHHRKNLEEADAILLGRVTYEMMESAWRGPAPAGARPEWMEPFARTMDAAKKYVVSSTLDRVDWNSELVRGDLGPAVQRLKQEPGRGLLVGGLTLPLALAELDLIDEYELVVQPRLAGHGPTLFAGLSRYVDLKLVSRLEFASGALVLRYEPVR